MDTIEILVALYEVLIAVFGSDTTIGARIASVVAWLVILTGSASYIVKLLEAIVDVTPTDKDNMALDKFKRYLAKLVAFLDRIAANPDKLRARDPDK